MPIHINLDKLCLVVRDAGGQTITSIITGAACRDLGLKAGDTAAALIKATEAMMIAPCPGGFELADRR